jgi:hypothetical protein
VVSESSLTYLRQRPDSPARSRNSERLPRAPKSVACRDPASLHQFSRGIRSGWDLEQNCDMELAAQPFLAQAPGQRSELWVCGEADLVHVGKAQ